MKSVPRDEDSTEETSWDKGNFKHLLDFRIDSGDVILKEHFETAPKNAKYNSKTIQNEIINSIGGFITDEIIEGSEISYNNFNNNRQNSGRI